MNQTSDTSPSVVLYLRYGLNVRQSLPIIEDWLKKNPQNSETTLSKLISSGKVILKNKQLYEIPTLSLQEAISLSVELHKPDGVEVKNRRYGLKVYRQCFIGSELVNWLIKNKKISAEEAIALGTSLFEHNLISHVCNDHEFKNDFLFYRFTN